MHVGPPYESTTELKRSSEEHDEHDAVWLCSQRNMTGRSVKISQEQLFVGVMVLSFTDKMRVLEIPSETILVIPEHTSLLLAAEPAKQWV